MTYVHPLPVKEGRNDRIKAFLLFEGIIDIPGSSL